MRKVRILASVVVAAVLFCVTGCRCVPGTILDKSKPMAQGGYTVVGDEVSATECSVYIMGIPMSDLRGSAGRRMYKSALSQAPGADALIEYTTDLKTVDLSIITIIWYTLTGTPVKTNK